MESLSGTDMLILAHARSVAAANISSLTTMAVGMESDVNSFFTLSEAFSILSASRQYSCRGSRKMAYRLS